MFQRSRLSLLAVILLSVSPALAQKTLTATEAKDHIGEQGTVCGKVVSTRYAESSRGSPTFLNFDQPYPNQVFTLLIWEATARNLATQKRLTVASAYVLRGNSLRSRASRKS